MKKKLLLYGIGIISAVIENCLDEKKTEIVGYVLDEQYKTDEYVKEKKVYVPNELDGVDYDYIIICINSAYLEGVRQRLLDNGVQEEKILSADVHDSEMFKRFLARVQSEYNTLFKIDKLNSLFKEPVYENAYICNMNRSYQPRKLAHVEKDYVRHSTLELLSKVIEKKGICGNVAELGVYKGDFAKYINALFPKRTLYLFDTFEGFDKKDIDFDNAYGFSKNINDQFKDTSVNDVLSKMPYPKNCIVKKGYFPETAVDVEDTFCFVSIDTDLYTPIYEGLRYFYPRLSNGGYILIHDYFNSHYRGVSEAVEQFCETNGIWFVPVSDEYGSVIITKNER